MKVFTISTNLISQRRADLLLNLLPHYYKIKEISFQKLGNKGVFKILTNDDNVKEIDTVFDEFGYSCQID